MPDTYSRVVTHTGFGVSDTGTVTSLQVDTTYTAGSAGEAVGVQFVAPVSQTSATLAFYIYCTATTGSPTFKMEVRTQSGSNANQPNTSPGGLLATSDDVTPVAGRWVKFTVTVSLTRGETYWVIIYNSHATPASNHATLTHRGSLDYVGQNAGSGTGSASTFCRSYSTTNGFSTNPSFNTGTSGVLVFNETGTKTLLGNPYVATVSHASNTNHRGSRFRVPAKITISGIQVLLAANTNIASYRIYNGSTAVVNETATFYGKSLLAGARFAEVDLQPGVDYDVVATFSANTTTGTIYDMGDNAAGGANLPADVLACRPPGLAYVDGTTPGSYTARTDQVMLFWLLIDDAPAASGGMLVHPGMLGGARG